MKCIMFPFCFFLLSVCVAQNERGIARDGNSLYTDSLYQEAEIQYKKSLSQNKSFNEAKFNLSNTLSKQARYSESVELLNDMVKTTSDSLLQSEVYYNMGNNYIMMADNNTQDSKMINESLQNAINSYKNCLKINPSDEEARHNLSKTLRRLEKQKNNQNNENQEKDQNKKEKQNSGETDGEDEKNKENKKNDNNNESPEGGKSSGDKKEQGESNGELLDNQLSKEDVSRMLEALDREEKEVQEKMRKIKFSKQKNKQTEKDW